MEILSLDSLINLVSLTFYGLTYGILIVALVELKRKAITYIDNQQYMFYMNIAFKLAVYICMFLLWVGLFVLAVYLERTAFLIDTLFLCTLSICGVSIMMWVIRKFDKRMRTIDDTVKFLFYYIVKHIILFIMTLILALCCFAVLTLNHQLIR